MRRNNLSVLSQLHCPNGISPVGNSGCFPRGKPAATESRYQTSGTCWVFFCVCVCVSVIHRTLTWTTGSLTWAQMLMHATAHGGVRTHVRESALKVDSGRKIPCCRGESNLRQQHDGPMLCQWATSSTQVRYFFLKHSPMLHEADGELKALKPELLPLFCCLHLDYTAIMCTNSE